MNVSKAFNELAQKVNLREKELQNIAFSLERQKKINEIYLLAIIIISLCGLIVLGYFVHKRRQQHILIAKLKVENQLKKAQNEVNMFILKINEQAKITEALNEELNTLKDSESEERKTLEKTKILTDENWVDFQAHFSTIYPSFVTAIKSNYPSITNAEIRYLMLCKLQLSHKEMSQALGVSTDTIRVTWNRVRKKLGGTLEDTPLSLIEKIS
ncbi:MAG TPA: hypothetical protein PLP27_01355 [Crocinitomicaceae bacterium]|nr:hypothetical protein [Crocinitomicaceae bacterium]